MTIFSASKIPAFVFISLLAFNCFAALPPIQFTDATFESGLTFVHRQGGEKLTSLDETQGSGACALDYDNDGWMDILLVGGAGQTYFYGQPKWWHQSTGSRLYRNTRDGQFVLATNNAGIETSTAAIACVAGDLDNDGDTDLIISTGKLNQLYQNNGDGSFSNVTQHAGLHDSYWTTGIALADYDQDGLLDIHVTNYIQYTKGQKTLEQQSGFSQTMDLAFDAALYDPAPNLLYRNTGKLQFTDVTTEAGTADKQGRGMMSLWQDVNHDQWLDLIVSNDAATANRIFINQKNGKFIQSEHDYQFESSSGTRSICSGDLWGDAKEELLLTSSGLSPLVFERTRRHENDVLPFKEISRESGLYETHPPGLSSWSCSLQDFNNDSILDVFVTHGRLMPDPDSRHLPQGQANQFWINDGEKLQPVLQVIQPFTKTTPMPHSSRASIHADFDNDGDNDLIVTNNNDMVQYLRNDSPAKNWIGLHLKNKYGNSYPIGTRLVLQTRGQTIHRTFNPSQGLFSTNDNRLLISLGASIEPVKLTVTWPDGTQEQHPLKRRNQYIQLTQGQPPQIFNQKPGVRPAEKPALLDPENRYAMQHYLQWVDTAGTNQVKQQTFSQAASHRDKVIRQQAIEFAKKQPADWATGLLANALFDDDQAIRLKALAYLASREDERTMRWLFALIHDPDPVIQCAIADVLTKYFHEEEAVIHRKWLAIPLLTHALSIATSDTAPCLIRALAASEHYRALQPVIQASQSNNTLIAMAATSAMAWLPEAAVAKQLKHILNDSTQADNKRVQALAALIQLKQIELDDITDAAMKEKALQQLGRMKKATPQRPIKTKPWPEKQPGLIQSDNTESHQREIQKLLASPANNQREKLKALIYDETTEKALRHDLVKSIAEKSLPIYHQWLYQLVRFKHDPISNIVLRHLPEPRTTAQRDYLTRRFYEKTTTDDERFAIIRALYSHQAKLALAAVQSGRLPKQP